MYTIIWKYTVKAKHQGKFELEYGPRGSWSGLFGRSQDYLGSELYQSLSEQGEYLLTDHWRSKGSYDQFLDSHDQHYVNLSHQFEHLYEKEEKLGSFGTF